MQSETSLPSVAQMAANRLITSGQAESLEEAYAEIARRQWESQINFYKQPRELCKKLSDLFLGDCAEAKVESVRPTGVKVYFDAFPLAASGGSKISIKATAGLDRIHLLDTYKNHARDYVLSSLTRMGDAVPHIETKENGTIIITTSKDLAAFAGYLLSQHPAELQGKGKF